MEPMSFFCGMLFVTDMLLAVIGLCWYRENSETLHYFAGVYYDDLRAWLRSRLTIVPRNEKWLKINDLNREAAIRQPWFDEMAFEKSLED